MWGDLVEPEDTWFGLFEEDSGYELRMVELELVPGEPPMDEWERPGGTEILLPNEPERPLISLLDWVLYHLRRVHQSS